MGVKRDPVKIPPVVVKNFLYLNLLIILTLTFSAFGLHYFLRPKALPTFARTGERDRLWFALLSPSESPPHLRPDR